MTIVHVSEVRAAIQDMYENEQFDAIENIINDLEILIEKNSPCEDDYAPICFQEK